MVLRRRAVPGEQETGDLTHDRHNASGAGFAGETLLSFIERYERLTEEISGLTDDRKEVMSEAKGSGFDTKIMRMLIRERQMDQGTRQETNALLELYRDGVARAEKVRYNQSISDSEPAPPAAADED